MIINKKVIINKKKTLERTKLKIGEMQVYHLTRESVDIRVIVSICNAKDKATEIRT